MEVEELGEMGQVQVHVHGHGQESQPKPDKEKSAKEARNKVMCNQLILDKITSALPSKTLLELRKTCTDWNRNFIPALKQNHEPILTSACTADYPRPVNRYIEVMSASLEVPFARFKFDRFHLHGWDADESFSTNPGRIFNFVSKFGESITSLNLHWCSPKVLTIPELWKIVFELTPNLTDLKLQPENLDRGGQVHETDKDSSKVSESGTSKIIPNLKRLATACESYTTDGMNPAFITLVAAVLQTTPNLESLNLHDGVGPEYEYMPSTIATLQSLSLGTLKVLSISVLESAIIRALLQMGRRKENSLRLEQFSGELYVPVNNNYEAGDEFREMVQLLRDFLLTQASTLKSLNLELHDDDVRGLEEEDDDMDNAVDVPRFQIPRLEQLTKMKLITSGLNVIKVKCGDSDGDFQSAYPRLSKFSYRGDLDDNFVEISHTGVTSLDVSGIWRILFQENLRSLPVLFPAVTRLTLDKTSSSYSSSDVLSLSCTVAQQMSSLWTLWPGLTHLHAHVAFPEGTTPDEWLSGVASTNFPDLQRELDALPRPLTRGSLCVLLCPYKTRPGLANLRQLKELKLDFTPPRFRSIPSHSSAESSKEEPEARVTDLGGYFGLGVASYHLQHLEIRGSPKNAVSDGCLAFIRSGLPLYAVIEL